MQICENGNRPNILSHHLSLPKSSPSEMAAMEKLLHLQDTVPCKVRAKRGCATHPRSIAERVRFVPDFKLFNHLITECIMLKFISSFVYMVVKESRIKNCMMLKLRFICMR